MKWTLTFLPLICIPLSSPLLLFKPSVCVSVRACWLPICKLLSSLPTQVVLQNYTAVTSSSVYLNIALLKCLRSFSSLNRERNMSLKTCIKLYLTSHLSMCICISACTMKMNLLVILSSFTLHSTSLSTHNTNFVLLRALDWQNRDTTVHTSISSVRSATLLCVIAWDKTAHSVTAWVRLTIDQLIY